MKYKTLIILFLFLFCFVTPTYGEFTVKQYENHRKTNPSAMGLYVLGVGVGITSSSTYIKGKGYRFLCPPEDLIINEEMYIGLLEYVIRKLRQYDKERGTNLTDDTPTDDLKIEVLLLNGLIRRYPCPEDK